MFIGYLLLTVSATSLFVFSAVTSFVQRHFLVFLIVLSINILLFFRVISELIKLKLSSHKLKKVDVYIIIFSVIGAISAYILNVYIGLGAIVSSALIGLIGVILIPKYSVSIYCGSFVGMVSPLVLHDFYHVLIAGFMAGTVLMLSEEVYKGYGGKLGASAFIPWVIMSLFHNVKLTNPQPLSISITLEILLFSIMAAFATYMISQRMKHDVVTASSLVSLIAGLILPAVFKNNGIAFAAVAMSASFAGMSSKKIIKNEFQMIIVSFLIGIMFVYSYCHFGGAGGKLGTLAFASVITYKGFEEFILFLKKCGRKNHE